MPDTDTAFTTEMWDDLDRIVSARGRRYVVALRDRMDKLEQDLATTTEELNFYLRQWGMLRERMKRMELSERYKAALERLTHESCGTNRVSQAVRGARQAIGWGDKGCAASVEAVRQSHARIGIGRA